LSREKICTNCELIHCSKCLTEVPVHQLVCRLCLKQKSQPDSSSSIPSLSTNFETVKIDSDCQDIDQRLQQLKADRVASDEDIEKRLRNLKEEEETVTMDNKYDWLLKPKPKITTTVEADNLLSEALDEHKISSTIMSPEAEIAQRLARLRGSASGDKLNEKPDKEYLEKIDHVLEKANVKEIHNTDEEIQKRMKGKSIETDDFDPTLANLDEVDRLLKMAHKKHKISAEISLTNEEIQKIMKEYAKAASKNTTNNMDEDDNFDAQELAAVIKEALLSNDEEAEIENM